DEEQRDDQQRHAQGGVVDAQDDQIDEQPDVGAPAAPAAAAAAPATPAVALAAARACPGQGREQLHGDAQPKARKNQEPRGPRARFQVEPHATSSESSLTSS